MLSFNFYCKLKLQLSYLLLLSLMKRSSQLWTAALCSIAGAGGIGVAYTTLSQKYEKNISNLQDKLGILQRQLEEQDQFLRGFESRGFGRGVKNAVNSFFSYADVVESVSPAIVSLIVESDETYVTFGGLWKIRQPRRAIGSGVIVRSDGIIATNNHVVEMADQNFENANANANIKNKDLKDVKYTVHLHDGTTYSARPLLRDSLNDLALLKIIVPKSKDNYGSTSDDDIPKFPFIRIGDVTAMRIGDRVLAIGNNFGFQNTVTDGIISAIGRSYSNANSNVLNDDMIDGDGINSGDEDYYAGGGDMMGNMNGINIRISKNPYLPFLQTNANINQGSSGGPLIDVSTKELIGINTAIASPIGVNIGIGFSVPASYVLNLLRSLDEPYNGQFIIRPWDGLKVVKWGITKNKIDSINNNNNDNNNSEDINNIIINKTKSEYIYGASIIDMHNHSPAKEAGILFNDIIVMIDDVLIDGPDKYWMALSQVVPDSPNKIGTKYTVLRYNDEIQKYQLLEFVVNVTLPYQGSDRKILQMGKDGRGVFDGCKFIELQPFNGIEMGQSASDCGILLMELPLWGNAYRMFGFEPGDVILEINGQIQDNLQQFENILKNTSIKSLHIVIKRNDLIGEITIN